MPASKRVYPGEKRPAKGLSYLLLFLSAVIILSGVAGRSVNAPILQPVATSTPIPLEDVFDETKDTREITLTGTAWYALQLGAFEDEKAAEELAERFRPRGAAGYVWHEGRYRVLAAIYPSKTDAQNVRRQLLAQHAIETFVYEISWGDMTLRASGMRGQIDILEAAFLHAGELIQGLQALSVLMDRQEMNVAEAQERLSALANQTGLVALRLEQRFPTPREKAVQGLIELFRDYEAFQHRQSVDQSAVACGQQIKFQAIQSLRLFRSALKALEST